jgi:hypothetical protein
MFKNLCENLNKMHINPLLHIETWWLGRGRVLKRVSELKGELQDYFQENSRPYFAKLNKSLKGLGENFVTSSDKILGFKRKLNHWKNHVEK